MTRFYQAPRLSTIPDIIKDHPSMSAVYVCILVLAYGGTGNIVEGFDFEVVERYPVGFVCICSNISHTKPLGSVTSLSLKLLA